MNPESQHDPNATAPHSGEALTDCVQLPLPTAWPMVLAIGITLLAASLLTHWSIGLLGLILTIRASIGWFGEVLPHEKHESIAVVLEPIPITSRRSHVSQLALGIPHAYATGERKVLPFETYTITAGVRGGIAGGIAMTGPAVLYGLIKYHSLWYSMNLLAASAFPSWSNESTAFLSSFHLQGLIAALILHILVSLLVGLLYGAMLPMFPRYPILTAGFIAPLLWTGLLHSILGLVNPLLNQRIDWLWFVISQSAFGLVTGFVVNLQVKVRTPQFRALPFAVRAGFETAVRPESTTENEKHEDGRE